MYIDIIVKLLEAGAKLISAVAWPAVALFILIRFGPGIRDFIRNMGEFSLKAVGFEASGKREKAEATAALTAAAVASPQNDANPREAAEDAREAAEIVAAVTPGTIRRAARSSVLWVDDRPDNNLYEREALRALGVTFILAMSTDEAITKLKKQAFDVIISDMSRPPDTQAGYTLLSRLREENLKIPLIIYAGSGAVEHQAEALQRGAIGCTNRANELFEMVLSVLGRSRIDLRTSKGYGIP